MSRMKNWMWELIENGKHEYLRSIGAPAWAVAEARAYARLPTEVEEDEQPALFRRSACG
jgi:hypothetical protein